MDAIGRGRTETVSFFTCAALKSPQLIARARSRSARLFPLSFDAEVGPLRDRDVLTVAHDRYGVVAQMTRIRVQHRFRSVLRQIDAAQPRRSVGAGRVQHPAGECHDAAGLRIDGDHLRAVGFRHEIVAAGLTLVRQDLAMPDSR